MNIKYKYLFMFILVIPLFLFIDNVNAETYKASVINPPDSKCDVYKGSLTSTGLCLYKDSNLNSTNSSMVWLDTGDEVTVYTDYQKVPSNNKSTCSDYYVYVGYYYLKKSTTYYGYYCNANLVTNALTDELKSEFEIAGFPESYFEKLAILKKAHPNWTFKAVNTKLKFDDVINEENSLGRSLIQVTGSTNNEGYLNTWSGSYDYYTDTFTPFDGSTWYAANYDTIAYYVDPRNFLSDMYIFQFEKLSYDADIGEDLYKKGVTSIFGNGYLSNFIDDFLTAGKESNASPTYLASLSRQEVGNGSTPGTAINGEYNGMYNFYNIGATSSKNPVYNGLDFASKIDEATKRPWDTEYKAIVGGALWITEKYLRIGQDTIYFKKWDVVSNINSQSGSDFVHQYQTGIQAPSSEAYTTYKSYFDSNLLDFNYVFYIPVYLDMPEQTKLPNLGNPNNYLKSMSINGNNIAGFDGAITTYNYNLDINNSTLVLDAQSVNSKAKIEGLGTFKIEKDTVKTIKVIAENGSEKTYNINVTLTGEKLEDPVDVLTTLNNSGIKNNDKYLSGFTIGNGIEFIKDKINIANPSAIVQTKSSDGNIKSTGVICTGDKVTITVGDETRDYEVVIYGDVNGDGKISPLDYARVKNTFLGKSSLSGAYKEAADVNKNGSISAIDYARIKNTFLNKSSISQ